MSEYQILTVLAAFTFFYSVVASRLAEYTLALVLFADSANANLGTLRKVEMIPAR